MCGRYSLFASRETLEARFGVSIDGEFEPRYNAAPGQELPAIADSDPDRVRNLEWGLVPRWADDASDSYINARSETVDEKPAFAAAYENRRCLVPADGFYEWPDGGQPHRVAYEDNRPFAMAGLWERWIPETTQTGLDEFTDGNDSMRADPLETFTVLTTTPNEVVEPLHHRMAVILDQEQEDAWLAGESVSLDPPSAETFRSYPVSTAVNDPSNDRPALVEQVDG
jgi:putative SOS response-associated peptidase YedK